MKTVDFLNRYATYEYGQPKVLNIDTDNDLYQIYTGRETYWVYLRPYVDIYGVSREGVLREVQDLSA